MTEYYRDRVPFGGPTKPKTGHRLWPWLLGAALIVLGALLAKPAHATETWGAGCGNLTGWHVNGDEDGSDPKQGDRHPEVTAEGLKFSGSQLIHHATSLPIADLKPGTYTASPAPSLDSFFSVEVLNDNGTGYATLRWNTTTSKWDMTTGGQQYSDADPAALVADHAKGTTVVSFGVGYVNTPNDGTATVVSSVSFAGKTYDLTCAPKPSGSSSSATPKPTATKTSATPKPHSSSSTAAGAVAGGSDGGALAITGPSTGLLVGGGVLLLVLGGLLAALVSARRHRTRFIP